MSALFAPEVAIPGFFKRAPSLLLRGYTSRSDTFKKSTCKPIPRIKSRWLRVKLHLKKILLADCWRFCYLPPCRRNLSSLHAFVSSPGIYGCRGPLLHLLLIEPPNTPMNVTALSAQRSAPVCALCVATPSLAPCRLLRPGGARLPPQHRAARRKLAAQRRLRLGGRPARRRRAAP
eukprot:2587674-Pleurochrysis_carterae.AAC.2